MTSRTHDRPNPRVRLADTVSAAAAASQPSRPVVPAAGPCRVGASVRRLAGVAAGVTAAVSLLLALPAAPGLVIAAAPAPTDAKSDAGKPAAPAGTDTDKAAAAKSPLPVADAAQAEHFEKVIRPLLAEHCFSCHGQKKSMAGLRLDTPKGVAKGSDGGPVIVPGKPHDSSLVKVLQWDGDVKMPPKTRLPEPAVAALRDWVSHGAYWPTDTGPSITDPAAAAAKHWAFQPVGNPVPPKVKDAAWPADDVDRFVLARLETAGLRPNPDADRRTLIRRASIVVTGLPPTPEEVAAFEADPAPDAWAKVVDRLLASPRYGERWGRHWLDVARYADTKGYVFQEERRYPYSHTYRDYVIRAFNEDLPYDRFIVEQLAADRLKLEDPRPLAAMGFLTLGRRFLNNIHDIIDDRLDVVGRGLMGLTIACARCHDHKFDPIPTADYYSLYGVFNSSVEPKDLPLLATPVQSEAFRRFEADIARREAVVATYLAGERDKMATEYRKRVGEALVKAADKTYQPAANGQPLAGELPGGLIRRWRTYLADGRKAGDDIWAPWRALAAIPAAEWAAKAPGVIARFAPADAKGPDAKSAGTVPVAEPNPYAVEVPGAREAGPKPAAPAAPAKSDDAKPAGKPAEAKPAPAPAAKPAAPAPTLHPAVAALFAGETPKDLADVAARYGRLFLAVDNEWKTALKDAAAGKKPLPAKLADPARERLRAVLYGGDSPVDVPQAEIETLINRAQRDRLRDLRKEVDRFRATSPDAPPRVMVLVDKPAPADARILVRGNPGNQGAVAPRRFLSALSPAAKPFTDGSGRLELARAIASPDNPLTARVMVNRVWMHHFGKPLVPTVSDFGLRSEPPSHPELLDHLARRFMDGGWSLKKLHRALLLSRAWRQSSADRADGLAADPENRLLWKANRLRLDFEALRDSVLAVGGGLDLTMGGAGVDITAAPWPPRRSVYAFIERQNLPGVFRTFDFASPDISNPQRHQTTVPQQALFLMNHPFLQTHAGKLAERAKTAAGSGGPEAVVRALVRLAWQREPSADELAAAVEYLGVAAAPAAPVEPSPWRYGYGALAGDGKSVGSFTPLPHFTGTAWQGGPALPDGKAGWAMLTAEGGHPGSKGFAAIRRWVAPTDGTFAIEGRLSHPAEQGDGVRGLVVVEGVGVAGQWTVKKGRAKTDIAAVAVKKGTAVDFVVECNADISFDSFLWAPVIKSADGKTWAATADFAGPTPAGGKAADRATLLAQVLLLSNEFAFVD